MAWERQLENYLKIQFVCNAKNQRNDRCAESIVNHSHHSSAVSTITANKRKWVHQRCNVLIKIQEQTLIMKLIFSSRNEIYTYQTILRSSQAPLLQLKFFLCLLSQLKGHFHYGLYWAMSPMGVNAPIKASFKPCDNRSH